MQWIEATSLQKPPSHTTLFLRINDPIFNDEYYYDVGCWFDNEKVFKTTMILESVREPKPIEVIDDIKVKVTHWCLPTDPTNAVKDS
jgi:hypothetical protein